jgi:membrane-associated phospholipid phosphatase
MTTYDQPTTEAPTDTSPRYGVRLGAAVVALLCAVGVWVVQQAAVQSEAGQRRDDRLLDIVMGLAPVTWETPADRVSEGLFGAAIIVTLAIGLSSLVQLRPDRLAVLAITVGGANLATQLLKHVVIERPAYSWTAPNSLPSGHVTMVAAVAVMLVLLTAGALRTLLIVVATVATFAVSAAVMVAGWHRPSDVVAAVLVCGCFAALTVAAVGPDSRPQTWA